MKIALFILMSSVISCSGGGGGDKTSPAPVNYTVNFIYPENSLLPGQGIIEVAPVEAKCLDDKLVEVDLSFCGIDESFDLSTAEKITHKSPAGEVTRPVANTNEEEVTFYIEEGKVFDDLTNEEKVAKLEEKISCLPSFEFTYQGTCEIPDFEYSYGEFPENTMNACEGSKTATRPHDCLSNITGVSVDEVNCGHLPLDNTTLQFSPEGSATATLSNGDTSVVNCEVGKTALDAGVTIISTISCGEDRYMDNETCVDHSFTQADFLFPANTLNPGEGNRTVTAIGFDTCIRNPDLVVVEVEKCGVVSPVPTVQLSPAGEMQVTLDNATGPVTVTVGEGMTWEDIPVEEQFTQLNGKVSCDAGMLFAHNAQCLIPSYSAVLGEYPENPLMPCDGDMEIYQDYSCLYNITNGLTDSSNCASTGEGMTVFSPAGIKNGVGLPNGDLVDLLCGVGATEDDLGDTTAISSYLSCGQDRYMNDNVCIPEVFTATNFDFTEPTLNIGDGTVAVSANFVTECRRGSDNEVVAIEKCAMPDPVPTKNFLSPAGNYPYENIYGDSMVFVLSQGEAFDAESEPEILNSCGARRMQINGSNLCKFLEITYIRPVDRNSYFIKYDDGTAVVTGQTKSYTVPAIDTLMNTAGLVDTIEEHPLFDGLFIKKSDGKMFFWKGSTVVDMEDSVRYFYSDKTLIGVNAEGVGKHYLSPPSGYSVVPLTGIDFNTVQDIICVNIYLSSVDKRSGCVVLYNNKTTAVLGANIGVTYNLSTNTSGVVTASGVTDRRSTFSTNIEKMIHPAPGSTFGTNVIFLKTDGTVVAIGQLKDTAWGVTLNSGATVYAELSGNVRDIIPGRSTWTVVKNDNSAVAWSPDVSRTLIGANSKTVAKETPGDFIFSDGSVIMKSSVSPASVLDLTDVVDSHGVGEFRRMYIHADGTITHYDSSKGIATIEMTGIIKNNNLIAGIGPDNKWIVYNNFFSILPETNAGNPHHSSNIIYFDPESLY